MGKWWLISDKDVNTIRKALQAPTHKGAVNPETTCPEYGCWGCAGNETRRGGLHALDSGLQLTEEIPGDFKI